MDGVKILSMDDADRLGYEHDGNLYEGNSIGLDGAKTMVRMLMDTGVDAVVVILRVPREWGGAVMGYAVGKRGDKR